MPRNKEPEFTPPKKKLCDHENKVKLLYGIQTKVSTSLKSELLRKERFTPGNENISEHLAPGTSTVTQLQEAMKTQMHRNELRQYGLSDDEVDLYQSYVNDGIAHLLKTHSAHEPEIMKAKLQKLEDIIKSKQINNIRKDIGPAIIHPMEEIKKIEKLLVTSAALPSNITAIRRKARKLRKKIDRINCSTGSDPPTNCSDAVESSKKTQWDVKDIPIEAENRIIVKKTPYTCQKQNFYTINNGVIVKLDGANLQPHGKFQIGKKLSVEEIQNHPQFANYTSGKSSKVLYIKNLPKNITDEFLKTIFVDQPALEYKLMHGKMRGQAFVTFPTVESATDALNDLNGTIINTKPIVIQFGKKGTSENKEINDLT